MKLVLKMNILLIIIIVSNTLNIKSQIQDQSDKNLSIIVPKAVAKDIVFGKILNNSIKDSVISDFIQNIGKPAIRIDKIEINGKNAREFALITNIFPFIIQHGNSKNIEFRFKPRSIGIKTAIIIIITQTDTLTYNIIGECVESKIEVITDIIDFGKIPIYTQSDKTIESAIKNIGTINLKIYSIEIENKDESQFSILEDLNSFELKPGENISLKLGFIPNKIGRASGKIKINYENSYEAAIIQLYGECLPVYAIIKGTVKDPAGNPLEVNIGWELIKENNKNIELGYMLSSGIDGNYEFKVPIGKNYGYFFQKQSFANVSEVAILENTKKEIIITKNIIMKKPCGSVSTLRVFFETNKSELKPESFSELDRLVNLLKENPDSKIEISGHTDNIGKDDSNLKLSQERANSVVDYLIKQGCKKEKLDPKGYGMRKPVADNNTDDGRSENRRVECKFLCK